MPKPTLVSLDLSHPGHAHTLDMPELQGDTPSVRTRCTIERTADAIVFTLLADDPDPFALISTAPTGKVDQYLYEEDALQLAIAWPGDPAFTGFLLINPHGNRKAAGEATGWTTTQIRRADGWSIAVNIPLPNPQNAALPQSVGVSALRFFRGVNHEAHALGQSGPHPVDVALMAVLSLVPGDANAAGEKFRDQAQRAKEALAQKQVDAVRARMAARLKPNAPRADRATLEKFITARLTRPVTSNVRALCWNEQHFLNALLDLWDITRDRRWVDAAVPRIEQVFAARTDRTGVIDPNWGAVLPTWYEARADWAMPLVTGVILWPIARLIRIVNTTPSLADVAAHVKPWIALCEESIAVHDREWIELPGGRGNYLEWDHKGPRRVYPTGGSRICPLNRSNFLGMAMLDLAAVTGNETYHDRTTKLARFFREGCELLPGGQLVWEYLHTRYATTGEDLSHAGCQVFFAQACEREGVVLTQADLRAMARTLDTLVFQHGDVPAGFLRGFDPQLDISVGAHVSLTRFAPDVLPKIVAVIEAAMAESSFDFANEGWGMRLLSQIEKARAGVW